MAGPEVDHTRDVFEPLISGLFRPTKRPRVSCVEIVFVQGLRDKGQVLLLESLVPLEYELDLWGMGTFWVEHWGEAIGGGLL